MNNIISISKGETIYFVELNIRIVLTYIEHEKEKS